jgi:ABC-type cobalt transport system substrate-binding protein
MMMLSKQNMMAVALIIVALMILYPQHQQGAYSRASHVAMMASIAAPGVAPLAGVNTGMLGLGLQALQYLDNNNYLPEFMSSRGKAYKTYEQARPYVDPVLQTLGKPPIYNM